MTSWREPVASQHQPYMHQTHPHLLSVQHDTHHMQHHRPFVHHPQLDSHYLQRFTFQPQYPLRTTYPPTPQPTYAYMQQQAEQYADDTSSAILSETEQKAFSEFLNQLATDDILDSPAPESEGSSNSNPPLCENYGGQREDGNNTYTSAPSSIQYDFAHNPVDNNGNANNNKRSRGLRKNVYQAPNGRSMNSPTTHPVDAAATDGAHINRRQSSLDANGHHRNSDNATASYPNHESIRSAPTTPPAGSPSSRPTTPTMPDSPVSTAKKRVSGTGSKTRSRPSKPAHELLTESEKKANHIASEQRRRQNIRTGFDSLCEIVPTLTTSHRSEALILQKSLEHIQELVMTKNQIKERIRYLREMLGEPLEPEDNSGSDDGGPEDVDYY